VLKKLEPKILVTLFEVKKTVLAICLMVTSELRMSEAFHGYSMRAGGGELLVNPMSCVFYGILSGSHHSAAKR
jgi:hypothetical protein